MILREKMPELSGGREWINDEATKKDLLNGKPVLIHFWSFTDQASKEAMDYINKWMYEHRARLNVMAVHVPYSEEGKESAIVKREAEKLGMAQPILMDNERSFSDSFDRPPVPAYYLFDENGLLRQFHTGPGGMSRMEKWIERTVDYHLVKQ